MLGRGGAGGKIGDVIAQTSVEDGDDVVPRRALVGGDIDDEFGVLAVGADQLAFKLGEGKPLAPEPVIPARRDLDAADIAIFGRMVANENSLTLEGAGLFSHALSTHKADNEIDFWTAVDDCKESGDDAGAANMGPVEFTSACYYRYVGLNLDLLRQPGHLGTLSAPELRQVVDAFLRAAMLAVPSARKNSMNSATLPAYVLGLVKDQGQPVQLVNAFETPVASRNGLATKSVDALKAHHEQLKKTWNIATTVEAAIPEVDMNTFCTRILDAASLA